MMEEKNFENDYLMKKVRETKERAINAQIERSLFLGELKERVILALTKNQMLEKTIYTEFIDALNRADAVKIVLSRDVRFDRIQSYVKEAIKLKKEHKIVDGLSYTGEVGLVVVANDVTLPLTEDGIFILNTLDKILKKGLSKIYYESFNKKICTFHYDIIKNEIPEYLNKYKEISAFDRFFNMKCPICEKLGGKKRG